MSELLQQALSWVNANPGWAGLLVFTMAFSESLAIIGVIVPGVVILFGVGVMIGAGALGFWSMVAWAVIGAVLGDGLSFWLGRHYSKQLTSIWPFKQHPESLQRGIKFFERYGGKSVALGRFFGPVRAVIPLVAGMLNMSPSRFTIANILSALVWAPVYLLPGMAFGATLELASEVALGLVILLILLVAVLWFTGWIAHRVFLFLKPHSREMLQRLLKLGQRNRWLHEIAEALGNPNHPETAGLGLLAGILVLGSLLLALVTGLASDFMVTLDQSLQLVVQELTTPTGDHLMLAVSRLADRSIGLLVLVLTWSLLKIFKLPIAARHWLAGFGSIWLLTLFGEYYLLQNLGLIRIIPDVYLLRASVQFGLLAILLNASITAENRWRLYSIATVLISAVAIAQLYHGSALSAVFNALLTGLLWTTAIGVAFRTHGHLEKTDSKRVRVLSSIILLLVIASAVMTPKPPPRPLVAGNWNLDLVEDWWHSGWSQLPTVRHDVTQLHDQPLNLQYLGDPALLTETLKQSGWQQPPALKGTDWLAILAPSLSIDNFPVFPRSHNGHYDSIQLVKPGTADRLILRLWPGKFIESTRQQPVWIGSISFQTLQSRLGLLSLPKTKYDEQKSLRQLAEDLNNSALTYQIVNNQTIILIRED